MLDEHIRPENFGILPFIRLFGLNIPTYTLFMILALAAAFAAYKFTRTPLDMKSGSHRTLIVLTALLGGILGAKIPILLVNYRYWFVYPQNVYLLFSGRTIVGGLIGGFLAVILLKKALHINIRTGNDIAAPVALGMAVGRLGCFFAGCCYGIPAIPRWLGVDFGDGIPRYPTELYELVFDVALFLIFLHFKKTRTLQPGILFFWLLNCYLSFRFFLEFIRANEKVFLVFSGYQILCLLCLAVINLRYIIRKRKEESYGQQ